MNSNAVISAVGLTKVFKDFWNRSRVRAVNDIDFEVRPGEVFGLLGPNGSGKSTTIKMLLGLLHPTRGRVTIFGRPPEDVKVKQRIGYLPEESYLYRFLNSRETLGYYGTLFQIHRKERNKRTEELLEMVGLRSAARRPVGEYSKGMARRIGLAQALINDPDLLILDEPTSGLDPIGAKLVKDIIIRLGREFKKTILLSSHLLSDVEEVCDRVAILYGGKVQVQGTMEQVLAQRDKIQMTTDTLRPETLHEVEQVIERREGKRLTVSVPKDRLESLFLRIVETAHVSQVETHGSEHVGEIAGFLGGEPAGGRELLESLVRAETPLESIQPAPPPTASEPSVLAELIRPREPEAPPAATPDGPAQPPSKAAGQVDRDLLSDLTGDQK